MRNLPDAGDGAAKAIPHQQSPPRLPPPANVPVNHHMNGSQTAKPHTKGAGLRKFDQLAGQIDIKHNTIAIIRKGNRNAIVFTVNERDQQPLLDIRQHEPDGLRLLQPTRSGIGNINDEVAQQLITALQQFIARCRT
jgi:hypothetical protein